MLVACALTVPAEGPAASLGEATRTEPTVVLVSLDGFRWDYLDLVRPPNLLRIAKRGVRAEGLIPVFPSKTFPAHYTIVTGLYPGHHGIVSNDMRDPEIEDEFHLSNRKAVEDPRWWGGEPIWATAEKHGLTSAAMFWPGSEAPVGGTQPTYWHRYDGGVSYRERVDQVLAWLDLPPSERPRMVTLYFGDPNETSHRWGPTAPQTFEAVREVDARLGDLVHGIEERGLTASVNLVVVSDHGMADVVADQVVFLDDYVELKRGELFQQGALVQIFPRPGRLESIYNGLKDAHPRLAVYRPDDVPERYKLARHRRLPPILAVPDVGWEAFTRVRWAVQWATLKGDHGQDPSDPAMHGLFVAAGPAFLQDVRVERFESVEIYNLLATALGIEPAPNDGRLERVEHLLVESLRPAAAAGASSER